METEQIDKLMDVIYRNTSISCEYDPDPCVGLTGNAGSELKQEDVDFLVSLGLGYTIRAWDKSNIILHLEIKEVHND